MIYHLSGDALRQIALWYASGMSVSMLIAWCMCIVGKRADRFYGDSDE